VNHRHLLRGPGIDALGDFKMESGVRKTEVCDVSFEKKRVVQGSEAFSPVPVVMLSLQKAIGLR